MLNKDDIKVGQIYFDTLDKDYQIVTSLSKSSVCFRFGENIDNLYKGGNLNYNQFCKRMKLCCKSKILNKFLEILGEQNV